MKNGLWKRATKSQAVAKSRLHFSVLMQAGLVFCPGPKKMTNVSNDKHNALVWSNPEEGKDQISPGSQQKGHAKNPALSRLEQPRSHTPKSVNPMKKM